MDSAAKRHAANVRWDKYGRKIYVGLQFGRLIVIEDLGCVNREHLVKATCACGILKTFNLKNLQKGLTRSCGCLRRATTSARRLAHGHTHKHGVHAASSEYTAWQGMKQRCLNPGSAADARNYRDRGITVCREWADSFETFLRHVGRKPSPELTLDRIDNDRGYEPGNVRWASRSEQARNQRRSARPRRQDGRFAGAEKNLICTMA